MAKISENSGREKAWVKVGPFGGGVESNNIVVDALKISGMVLGSIFVHKVILKPAGEIAITYAKKKMADWGWIPQPTLGDPKQINETSTCAEDKSVPVAETIGNTCSKPHVDFSKLRLVGDLLFSGDTLVLYSSDGEGKSTLAMAICIDIASGYTSKLLPESEVQKEPAPQPVLYYDAELNDEDIQMRYENGCNLISDNLTRVPYVFNSVDDLSSDINKRTESVTTDITICIDNISAIIPTASPSAAHDLFIFQNTFKSKMRQKGCRATFIIVSHTTKTKPGIINENFFGSANIGNLSSTRIGLFSTRFGEEYKMIKIQKNRKFGKDGKVIVIKRVTEPYHHFEYHSTVPYNDATPIIIKQPTFKPKIKVSSSTSSKKQAPNQRVTPENERKIKEMLTRNVKPSIIAKKFNVSSRTIARYKKKFEQDE